MSEPILQVKNLQKLFPVGSSLANVFSRKKKYIHAVDGVTFDINRGEIYGLIGESGCGKTTTARLILRLIDATNGSISPASRLLILIRYPHISLGIDVQTNNDACILTTI